MFPYVNNTSKLPELLESIKNNRVPKKFTYRFLASLGFKSSADRDLIPWLESMSFLNSNGKPSQGYVDFRDPKISQQVLKDNFLKLYSDLFKRSPSACTDTLSELSNEFISLTRVDRSAADKMADTFLELCKIVQFDASATSNTESSLPLSKDLNSEISNVAQNTSSSGKKTFNININLPETTNEEVYRQIFKHLKEIL